MKTQSFWNASSRNVHCQIPTWVILCLGARVKAVSSERISVNVPREAKDCQDQGDGQENQAALEEMCAVNSNHHL